MGKNNEIKDKTGRNLRLTPENGVDKQKERLPIHSSSSYNPVSTVYITIQ